MDVSTTLIDSGSIGTILDVNYSTNFICDDFMAENDLHEPHPVSDEVHILTSSLSPALPPSLPSSLSPSLPPSLSPSLSKKRNNTDSCI